MALEGSPPLNLVGSSAAPTRSIQFELEGVYTGIGLLEAIALTGESWDSMLDFLGYSACSDPTPGTPISCNGTDMGAYARCNYGTATNADNYRVQYAEDPYTNWLTPVGGGYYDLVSPYDTTLGGTTWWKFRVAGENCSGLGPYETSSAFYMN